MMPERAKGIRAIQFSINADPFHHFLRALAEQVRRLNRKVEGEKLVLSALPELSLQIVEFAREHGRITMGDAIRLTNGNRNTLKQHFRALVEQGHLSQHGAGRGVWYELRSGKRMSSIRQLAEGMAQSVALPSPRMSRQLWSCCRSKPITGKAENCLQPRLAKNPTTSESYGLEKNCL